MSRQGLSRTSGLVHHFHASGLVLALCALLVLASAVPPAAAACATAGKWCGANTSSNDRLCCPGTICGPWGNVCQRGCRIGGVAYRAGALNPVNACQLCQPSLSTTRWAALANGTSCNDGDACSYADGCTSGRCGGTALTCSSDPCNTRTCDGTATCAVTPRPAGTTCDDGSDASLVDVCASGSCNSCVPDASASPRFVNNGDGTVTDRVHCLVWEKKDGVWNGYDVANICPGGPRCGDPHDVNNLYAWGSASSNTADGTAKTEFLDRLNAGTGFAGHTDWHLPWEDAAPPELESILLGPYPCATSPCIDPIFGPTAPFPYWSDFTLPAAPGRAWAVDFDDGLAGELDKAGVAHVRGVRGRRLLTIGWANLQWPPTLNHTVSILNRTGIVYGQVWIDGATSLPGPAPGLRAQLGFGPSGSDPAGNPAWAWVDASFNTNAGNNDEFVASLLPETTGTFHYLYRYLTSGAPGWLYADLNGPIPQGASPPNPGVLTVTSSGDTTPPGVPANPRVTGSSATSIELAWDAVLGDPSLHGYEVRRSSTSGGPYERVAIVTSAEYADPSVTEGATYFYVVRAVDQSFNFSGNSDEVSGTAHSRTVTLVFNVTVPATTDGTGRSVAIAGSLDRLDGGLPAWNPGGVLLTRVDATNWAITLTGREGTAIEYRYALGSWDFVEKGNACDELSNRMLTLTYGATGVQAVNDTVANWRNVAPCGN